MDNPTQIRLSEDDDSPASGLARRLARYRRPVVADGRPRSVRLVDRAIEDAGKTNKREE